MHFGEHSRAFMRSLSESDRVLITELRLSMTLHGRAGGSSNGAGRATGVETTSLGASGATSRCVGVGVDDTGFIMQSQLFGATTGSQI